MIEWGGWTWTYYTLTDFPGETSTPVGEKIINSQGYVCDKDGFVILASEELQPYTIIKTPFGYYGKVYDTGCPLGIIDVYTNW